MNDFEFTDHADDTLVIRPFGDPEFPGAAVEINEGDAVCVPAHKWPELCRAGYRSLGLLVPDLADIPDPALVDELTAITRRHFREADNIPAVHRAAALDLLAAGWRKP